MEGTEQTSWHAMPTEQVIVRLKGSAHGLTEEDALNRQNTFGKNVLPGHKKPTLVQIIIRQFLSPLIYVLIGAGVVSLSLGEFSDAVFIAVILFVNTLIGAAQEWKAETSAEALQNMMKVRATVKRANRNTNIDADNLVPGDLVLLESGNLVPADLRLLFVNHFSVEEAILTGESVPVTKRVDLPVSETASVGDRFNMAFAGTTVATGRATGIVVSTARSTEIGQIAQELSTTSASKAPLVMRMEKFAHMVSIVVLAACTILGVLGYWSGIPLEQIFFFAVAIAVSAIPEGLPIAMTVALSIGTSRMARRNVIVRKLTAVEGLGSCTMIATDKTGTLTVDQQTVKILQLASGKRYNVSGQGYNGIGEITDESGDVITFGSRPELDHFIESAVWCNDASLDLDNGHWAHQGDAVDAAILAIAYKAQTHPNAIRENGERAGAIPFESERKFAASYYRINEKTFIAVKGAVEVILEHAVNVNRNEVNAMTAQLADEGYRVLGLASAAVDLVDEDQLPKIEFLGLIALIDPPREGVADSIKHCHAAGIEVCMITGDHPLTALAIARDLNIAQSVDELITGSELEVIERERPDDFKRAILGKHVFARVSPKQKQQIVASFQASGHYVAVTGDGVNDAPALKTANIGIAMGYGTDVAKGTASIILTDNNFVSIAAGIEEGRNAYANLRKIIYLLVSTGAAELLMITLSLLAGTPLPFLPAQILWLNLVTNGIQDKGLAFESGERDVMSQAPRPPRERIFNRLMIQQTLVASSAMAVTAFGLWYYLLNYEHYNEVEARNTVLLLMVLLQNFHVFNTRSEKHSAFRTPLFSNWWLIGGIALAQLVHIVAMHVPVMQNLLQVQPISYANWTKLLLTAAIIVVVLETFKAVKKWAIK